MDLPSERWADLYRQAFPQVYRALAAVLFDREAALDALHDAFIEGLRKPPGDDRNLEGWLYRVALRRARRSRHRDARYVPLTAEPRASGGGIDESLDRIEVGRLLAMVTARQREVLVAHFYLGLPYDDVAQLLGIRPGTVAATINQAVTRMRKGVDPVA